MIIGHSVSDGDGVILAIDEPVAVALRRTQKQLVGLSYVAITHPEDVARNLSHIAALQPNGNSARIKKRYIGGDGDVVTLDLQVSKLGSGRSSRLIGTLSTLPSLADSIGADDMPYHLWRRAKDLLGIIKARDAVLGSDLFADHAWTTLLIVYVAEAESRIAHVDAVADQVRLSRPTLDRWIRVLQAKSLIEPLDSNRDALQLTQKGIDSVERLLANHPAMAVS